MGLQSALSVPRESTTEQSLGENKAELVDWAYLGTHEISN